MLKIQYKITWLFVIILSLLSCKNHSQLDSNNISNTGIGSSNNITNTSVLGSFNNTKFDINLYIENSESMDGYVNPYSKFETSIFSLLTNFSNLNLSNKINLHYINDTLLHYSINADDKNVKSFIYNLSKEEFTKRRKKNTESEFYEIFDKIYSNYDTNSIIVFISDCIYYPKKPPYLHYCVDTNSLQLQESGITRVFTKNSQKDFAAIILKMTSGFIGDYWDRCNNRISNLGGIAGCQRPYYILILGTQKYLRALLNSKILDRLPSGNLENFCFFQTVLNPYDIDFRILPPSGNGSYTLNGTTKAINNAKIMSNIGNSTFEFTIEVDFPKGIYDESFYTDINNYTVYGGNFQLINIDKPVNINSNTYTLKLQTKDLIDDTVKIGLVANLLPSWVTKSSSLDDHDIQTDPTEMKNTFGIKYILNGIRKNIDNSSNSKYILSVEIPISLQHRHLDWRFLMLIIIIIGVAIFAIIKNKQK